MKLKMIALGLGLTAALTAAALGMLAAVERELSKNVKTV